MVPRTPVAVKPPSPAENLFASLCCTAVRKADIVWRVVVVVIRVTGRHDDGEAYQAWQTRCLPLRAARTRGYQTARFARTQAGSSIRPAGAGLAGRGRVVA